MTLWLGPALVGLIVLAGAVVGDLEESRIYGKMFVAPIREGGSAPVCVIEPREGDFPMGKDWGDKKKSHLAVYVKGVESCNVDLLKSLNQFAKENDLRCYVICTSPKGILPEREVEIPEKDSKYFTAQEVEKRMQQLKDLKSNHSLDQTSLGMAVNRFWHEGLGYVGENDVVVAYIRGRVQRIEQFASKEIDSEELNLLNKDLLELHQELTKKK